MSKKITLSNIYNFIEGNTRLFTKSIQPEHIKQQIAYRMLLCKDDCMITKECKYCGCDVPGKMYVSKSCNNGDRFPDLMSKVDWEEFKKDKNIE